MTGAPSPAAFIHSANLLTYSSIVAGLGAVVAAQHGSGPGAGGLLAIAAIADTFDGRFARRFPRSRALERFGAQLDSLGDAVTFGLVPVVCMMLLSTGRSLPLDLAWWCGGFWYLLCAVTRLGHYNLMEEDAEVRLTPDTTTAGANVAFGFAPNVVSGFSRTSDAFTGVPTPVAALILASLMVNGAAPALLWIAVLVAGALMIAPLRIPRPGNIGLAAFVCWPVTVVVVSCVLIFY